MLGQNRPIGKIPKRGKGNKMRVQDQDGRFCDITKIEGNGEEFFIEGYYLDNTEDLTDESIDWILQAYNGEIYADWYSTQIDRAMDRLEDR